MAEVDATEAVAAAEALQETAPTAAPLPSDAEPIQIALVWTGIGDLHKGFFSDPETVRTLGQGLAGRVQPPANVHVRYVQEDFKGWIRLQLLPDTLTVPVSHDGDVIDLQALASVTMPLARYRGDVAARFDLRVESFKVGVESFRGATVCEFEVAGKPPPDGSVVSPCVTITGKEHCGQPGPGGVRFDAEAAKKIRTCLDL